LNGVCGVSGPLARKGSPACGESEATAASLFLRHLRTKNATIARIRIAPTAPPTAAPTITGRFVLEAGETDGSGATEEVDDVTTAAVVWPLMTVVAVPTIKEVAVGSGGRVELKADVRVGVDIELTELNAAGNKLPSGQAPPL
jgi:hypothetical protein